MLIIGLVMFKLTWIINLITLTILDALLNISFTLRALFLKVEIMII